MPQLSAPLWSSPPPAQEAPISLCWARAHMGSPHGEPSWGSPRPPSCPHPRPQGPGDPHSPVLHDAAHVVDGTVAQVGAQEVAHQLGRDTLPSDGQTRAPGLIRPRPAALHAQLLSATSSQTQVPEFALKMPPNPGLRSATGKMHWLPLAGHCLGVPGARGHSLHARRPLSHARADLSPPLGSLCGMEVETLPSSKAHRAP